jgi:hypothetical protein
MDGELKFSSPSTYVGAAVGGVVSKLVPVPYLSEAAGSAASTAVELLIDNFTGNGEPVGFEEFVYETTTSAVVGGLFGGAFNDFKPPEGSSKILYEGPDVIGVLWGKLGIRPPKLLDGFVKKVLVPAGQTYCTEAIEQLPDTHIWD